MLGSMVLCIFWPSFCCAVVPQEQFQLTAINTIKALCGATVVTFILSMAMRKGKVAMADMCNAALAGGVAIGATCNLVHAPAAFGIGVVAGAVCMFGYSFIQEKILKIFKIVFALGTGDLAGSLLSISGSKKLAYEDADEFVM